MEDAERNFIDNLEYALTVPKLRAALRLSGEFEFHSAGNRTVIFRYTEDKWFHTTHITCMLNTDCEEWDCFNGEGKKIGTVEVSQS